MRQEDKGTGAVTYSVFGRQMRFDLTEGFPLLTTKKVYWKGVLYELAWFLSGQSNIKYLVDNNVHIWDDYPYKIYKEKMDKGELPEDDEGRVHCENRRRRSVRKAIRKSQKYLRRALAPVARKERPDR